MWRTPHGARTCLSVAIVLGTRQIAWFPPRNETNPGVCILKNPLQPQVWPLICHSRLCPKGLLPVGFPHSSDFAFNGLETPDFLTHQVTSPRPRDDRHCFRGARPPPRTPRPSISNLAPWSITVCLPLQGLFPQASSPVPWLGHAWGRQREGGLPLRKPRGFPA